MKKSKVLGFDEIMSLYDELFPDRKGVRIDPLLKSATPKTVAERLKEAIRLSEKLIWKRHMPIPLVRPEGLIVLKLRAGSFQDVTDASKLLVEAEYDLKRLRPLAKRARVDKRLERLMEKLGLT